ncbi:MAG: thiamine-phosphate synthase family protein [Methanocellales archaeon]
MKPPCEIVTKKLLPSIRALIVKELSINYTQAEIANLLNISQPAVNYYLKLIEKKRLEQKYPLIKKEEIQSIAMEMVNSIQASGNISESIAMVCEVCRAMRANGLLCTLHKEELPMLSQLQICKLCIKRIEKMNSRIQVISELAEIVSALEEEAIAELIPEIGMNIAYALEKPSSPRDVASFPGRIIKVKGKPTATAIPEFGVSPTLSAILIKLNQLGSDQRCLIYIKNSEVVREAVKSLNFKYVETEEADRNWNSTLVQIASKIDLNQLEVILDGGGLGLEPLAYIFARNPSEAIAKLKKIAYQIK